MKTVIDQLKASQNYVLLMVEDDKNMNVPQGHPTRCKSLGVKYIYEYQIAKESPKRYCNVFGLFRHLK